MCFPFKKPVPQILMFNIFSHNGIMDATTNLYDFLYEKTNKNCASGLTSCMPRFSQMQFEMSKTLNMP